MGDNFLQNINNLFRPKYYIKVKSEEKKYRKFPA